MADPQKLRDKARKFEQRERWREALDVYERLLDELEPEEIDHALWNRIGDIRSRVGDMDRAVEAYERAVDAYADAGLHNNAIALCKKILRQVPGRGSVYLKLGRLSVENGFVADARESFLEYAERMNRAGKVDDSLDALREFADLSPGDREVRMLLAHQLQAHRRTEDAVEQLRLLLGELESDGEVDEADEVRHMIRKIDPAADVSALAAKGRPTPPRKPADGDWMDIGEESAPAVDTGRFDDLIELDEDIDLVPGLETGEPEVATEPKAPEESTAVPIEGLQTSDAASADLGDDLPLLELDGEETAEEPGDPLFAEIEPEEDRPSEAEGAAADEGLQEIQIDSMEPAAGLGEEAELESLVEEREDAAASLLDDSVPLDLDERGGVAAGAEPDLLQEQEQEQEPEPELEPELEQELEPEPEPEPEPEQEQEQEQDVIPDMGSELLEDTGAPSAGPTVDAADSPRQTVEPLLDRLKREPIPPGALAELHGELQGDPSRSLLDMGRQVVTRLGRQERYPDALETVQRLLPHRPDDTFLYQKQVELAFRSGRSGDLVGAYLDLAEHLTRRGTADKARAVYQRILEVEPGHELAIEKLGRPREPLPREDQQEAVAAGGGGGDFVDLGSLVFGDEEEIGETTRFTVPEEEPSGDEERDFAEMLDRFKRKVSDHIASEDSASHYDLGLAFKEMGLVNEAIGEFQVALRGGADPLATLEVLGDCFLEKRQYKVASRVLHRALELPGGSDAELIGVLYQLGRCEEETGAFEQAAEFYQRVLAMDIGFRDAAHRLDALPTP